MPEATAVRPVTRGFRLAILCAVLLALAPFAGPARAAGPSHPFLSTLTGAETPGGSFEDACGVALDSSRDIYVSDYYHHVVDVFGPGGGYQTQIVKEDPLDGPCGMAVDPAGNLYVNNYHRNVVRFAASEIPGGSGAVIDSGHSTGVAVDPVSGDLYVDDHTYIAVYEAPVLPGDEPAAKIELGGLADAYGIAVSSFPATAGDVYVADATTNTVRAYDPAQPLNPPLSVIDGAGTPQAGFVSLVDSAVAVDPSDGHVFVVDNLQPGFEHPAAVVDEFTPQGTYLGQLPHAIVDSEPSSLAVDSAGIYVTSGNWEAAGVLSFGPAAPGEAESEALPPGAPSPIGPAMSQASVAAPATLAAAPPPPSPNAAPPAAGHRHRHKPRHPKPKHRRGR